MAEPLDAALTPESASWSASEQRRNEKVYEDRKYPEFGVSYRGAGATLQGRNDGLEEVVTVYWRNPQNGRIEIHGVTRTSPSVRRGNKNRLYGAARSSDGASQQSALRGQIGTRARRVQKKRKPTALMFPTSTSSSL